MRSSMAFQRDEFRLLANPAQASLGQEDNSEKVCRREVLMAVLGAGKSHLLSVTSAGSHQTEVTQTIG